MLSCVRAGRLEGSVQPVPLCIAQPETYMQKDQGIQSEGPRRDRQAGRQAGMYHVQYLSSLSSSCLFHLVLSLAPSPSPVSRLSRMIRRQQAFSAYHCISMFKPRRTPPCRGRLLGCHHAQSLQPLTHVYFCLHRISAAEHKVVSALLGVDLALLFPNPSPSLSCLVCLTNAVLSLGRRLQIKSTRILGRD